MLRVGRIVNQHKMAKHFELTSTEDRFAYQWKANQIAEEAVLDGLYVIRISVLDDVWTSENTVLAYKEPHVGRSCIPLHEVDGLAHPADSLRTR